MEKLVEKINIEKLLKFLSDLRWIILFLLVGLYSLRKFFPKSNLFWEEIKKFLF